MYFLQISDTHFLEDYHENHDIFEIAFLNMTSPLEKVAKISQDLGDISLDFLVHCGDMCHSGQESDYGILKSHLEKVFPSVPMMATCGNRDDKKMVEKVFYGENRAEFFYVREFSGLQVISFDNANGTPQGELTEEMCRLLLNQLEKTQDIPTILCCHHHCIPDQIPTMKAVDCPSLFAEVMGQKNILALLTGHTHNQYEGTYLGVPCYTVAPLSFVARPIEGGQEVFEAGGYHLFSYENGVLTLEKVGDLGYHEKFGLI